MIKIFYLYLIKRSLYFSFCILIFFGLLDSVFNFISELENISSQFNISKIFMYVLLSMPHNLLDFLEGACLLGVMIALGLSHQEGNLNVLRTAGASPFKIILVSSIGAIFLAFSLILFDEIVFKKTYLNAQANKNLLSERITFNDKSFNWIKSEDSYLSFEDIIDNKMFKVRLIQTKDNQIVYSATSNTAKTSGDKIFLNEDATYKIFTDDFVQNNEVNFKIPIQSKITLKNINHLSLKNINIYRQLFTESTLKEDVLFKAHLDKALFTSIFKPISIMVLILFFGSLIFTSLRDSNVGERIVISVLGAFIYKIFQDLSTGIFISYGFPVLIGVLIPSIFIIFLSFKSYRNI